MISRNARRQLENHQLLGAARCPSTSKGYPQDKRSTYARSKGGTGEYFAMLILHFVTIPNPTLGSASDQPMLKGCCLSIPRTCIWRLLNGMVEARHQVPLPWPACGMRAASSCRVWLRILPLPPGCSLGQRACLQQESSREPVCPRP